MSCLLRLSRDIPLLDEMFPFFEESVLRSVYQANGSDLDKTIEALLNLTAEPPPTPCRFPIQDFLWPDHQLRPKVPERVRGSRRLRKRGRKRQRYVPCSRVNDAQPDPNSEATLHTWLRQQRSRERKLHEQIEEVSEYWEEALDRWSDEETARSSKSSGDGEQKAAELVEAVDEVVTGCVPEPQGATVDKVEEEKDAKKPEGLLVPFKIYCGDSIYRLSVAAESDSSYQQIRAKADELSGSSCKIRYRDDEGDWVRVCTQEELEEAVRVHCAADGALKVVKLHLV